jgi:protein-disulfide isomerase
MHSAQLAVPVNERDHTLGLANAPVTLVEYGDFECPHCGRAYSLVEGIRRFMGDNLRFVYRHFPLAEAHPHAQHAAEASEAAGAEGKFWEMHHMLFENHDALDDGDLMLYASQIGCDVKRVAEELVAGVYTKDVRDDFRGGVRSGVNGTPAFYINGFRHDGGWDYASLVGALRDAAVTSPPG